MRLRVTLLLPLLRGMLVPREAAPQEAVGALRVQLARSLLQLSVCVQASVVRAAEACNCTAPCHGWIRVSAGWHGWTWHTVPASVCCSARVHPCKVLQAQQLQELWRAGPMQLAAVQASMPCTEGGAGCLTTLLLDVLHGVLGPELPAWLGAGQV